MMTKKIIAVLFAFILTLSTAIPAFASGRVNARESLSSDEMESINTLADSIYQAYGYDVYFAYSTDDISAIDLAYDTLDDNHINSNGVCFAVTQQYYALRTTDDIADVFDGDDEDQIWSDIADYEQDGLYSLIAMYYSSLTGIILTKPTLATAPVTDVQTTTEPKATTEGEDDGIMLIDNYNNEAYYGVYLVDEACVLDSKDADSIEADLKALSKSLNLDVYVYIVDDYTGSLMVYADDTLDSYIDDFGGNEDSVLFLINTVNGKWTSGNCWISTTGYGITAFTDSGIQYIGKHVSGLLENGDYEGAIDTFMDITADFVEKAHDGKPFEYNPRNFAMIFGVALVVALIGAFVITSSLKAELKSVKDARDANNYLVNGSLYINQAYDTFLYKNVTTVKKQQSSSSGGSSTHSSSSGRSHGGGGF